MEARIIRGRTLAGLARGRAEGRIGGRRPIPKPTAEQVSAAAQALTDRGEAATLKTIARELQSTPWAIRCVLNPGLSKRRSSDGAKAPEVGV